MLGCVALRVALVCAVRVWSEGRRWGGSWGDEEGREERNGDKGANGVGKELEGRVKLEARKGEEQKRRGEKRRE